MRRVNTSEPVQVSLSQISDFCEWNPKENCPSCYQKQNYGDLVTYWGCTNLADFVVGARGEWRLCKSCAALPQFKLYRKRTPVKRG